MKIYAKQGTLDDVIIEFNKEEATELCGLMDYVEIEFSIELKHRLYKHLNPVPKQYSPEIMAAYQHWADAEAKYKKEQYPASFGYRAVVTSHNDLAALCEAAGYETHIVCIDLSDNPQA